MLREVLSSGVRLAVAGVVIGVAAAAAASRLIGTLLFEVSPVDALILTIAPALVLVVAAIGCAVPALRATRVDPVAALRTE